MIQQSAVEAARSETPPVDVARVAGRGTIYITAAKLWFMASGAVIYLALPRLLTPEQFGLYQVVIGIASIINAVVVTGTSQTVSKYISQDDSKADSVKSNALKLQLAVGGGLSLAFFLLAPVIASYLNDPRLAGHLRLASLITLSYSFYSVFTGYFNGQRKFLAQAGLDAAYSTLKLAFVVLFVWLGFGVAGGVGGFAMAAATVLAVSALAAGRGGRKGEVRIRDLFKFQAYLLLFTLVLNLLQKVDLILIKALSSNDATAASNNAGYYGAAIYLANLTYQVIISVTFVIFPLVSQAAFANDRARTRGYIANTLRYTLLIMAPLATLLSANAAEVLRVYYPADYQAGGPALAVVAYGMLFFGLLYVITTIISAGGRPSMSLATAAVTLVISIALNAALIPAYGLTGAATATTASMFSGVVMGGGYVLAKYGALMPRMSLLRIATCAGLVYLASPLFTPASKLMIIAKLVLLSLVYCVALVATGEVGRGDLAAVKRVLKK
ncbi:MAG: lipopolysaccharide biosynthesis protein [Blastocatellia bacterium]